MATKATAPTNDEALKKIEPLAKLLGKTAGELWKIFVWRYIAKGLGEVFLAIFGSWVGWAYLHQNDRLWVIPFLCVSGILIFDAIQLLVNPRYFAMNDVIDRLNAERNSKPGMTIYQK
jgi:hypothetical protein